MHEPAAATRRIDTSGISETIQRALAAAGLNTQSGPMKDVTDTINQALSSAGLTQHPFVAGGRGVTIDGTSRAIDTPDFASNDTRPQPDDRPRPASGDEAPGAGEFVTRTFTNDAGTRSYKLYIPAGHAAHSGEPVPMIVMLHGCTQSPDDFAGGTRMNALADQHGFLVVYPAQPANANGSKCWNWFRATDQVRDRGEPSIIAGITRQVASNHHVDARRIFVAGLSAGAAMAVILGALYPELYLAVGAHSGLPYGIAHDMPSAFAAMQGGAAQVGPLKPSAAAPPHRIAPLNPVPTIVFHGDQDRTVNARNGNAIVAYATGVGGDAERLRANVHEGTTPGGRRYRRTEYVDHTNHPLVEHWLVHGAGHAWSGGSPRGSFTDPTGPDASAEMIRFFLAQRRAGTS